MSNGVVFLGIGRDVGVEDMSALRPSYDSQEGGLVTSAVE